MSKLRFLQKVKLHEKALCKSKRARNRNSQRSKMKMLQLTRKEKNHTIIKKSVGYAKKNLIKKLMKTKATANYPYSKK